jgi:MFS transporter, NNP family, nitrate/nitrite transporter
MKGERRQSLAWHLTLSTFSFTLCFAVWGLMSASAPLYRERFELSGTETALLIAVPVLLGALARIPLGMLSDRFGARLVFVVLMLTVAVPVFFVPGADDYTTLLGLAFCLGLAGASFAVGVSYVAGWAPAAAQGGALGIYGLGTGGQSIAVFLVPLLAGAVGWPAVFRGAAALLLVWALAFGVLARNPERKGAPKGLADAVRVLRREPLAWLLALYYFVTFGGFVAFSIYLPTYLRDAFGLSPGDAGFRAAGFVVLATLLRPIGGWLADKIGGARVLNATFLTLVPFALLLCWPSILPFSVGALGSAALLGLGNGAVFKLVPQHFPRETGTVTGVVGAMGGLGGFFPPLVLGVFRDTMGVVWPGFLLLALTAAIVWWVNRRVLLPREEAQALQVPPEWTRAADRARAAVWATLVTALLAAAIVVGSRNLQNFDAALVVYTFAIVFATWGVTYHYRVWLQKPPTELYWKRGFELARKEGPRVLPRLVRHTFVQLFAQGFIRRRSVLRWWMHQLLFWGCLLAAAITFPLVFGWIHFGTHADDQHTYVTYVFGFPVGSFPLHSVVSWLVFHGLDISAVLVLGGIALALYRRMRERGAQTVQTFGRDLLPLVMLFAICVTGLMLTVSTAWLRGAFYEFLSIVHAITVIGTLLYLPFGKFFHIFQRPAQVGVKLYQEVGAAGEGAECARCHERFASRMHIDDLALVLTRLGFDYRVDGHAGHWQALCPRCKRVTVAMNQLELTRRRDDGPGGMPHETNAAAVNAIETNAAETREGADVETTTSR